MDVLNQTLWCMSAFFKPSELDYEPLAPRYDSSRGPEPAIVRALLDGLRDLRARRALELGAGTGNYTRELASNGIAITALDRSPGMVECGRAKADARWVLGDALALPLRSGAFEAVAAVNVLHHLPDLARALSEMRRVATRGAVLQAVVRENLSTLWYRRYFREIDSVLLPLHPRLGRLIIAMLSAGFSRVRTYPIFYSGAGDLTFEAGRTRPELLFEESFRSATSGFRHLSPHCIDTGLESLRSDLETGRFSEVHALFEHDHSRYGDCIAIVAKA